MRCPDCSKFVSFEDGDVDVSSEEMDDNIINITVRIVKLCAECGTELKEGEIEIEQEVLETKEDGEEVEHGTNADGLALDGHELTIARVELDNDQWSKGKGRWTETFYGVSGDVTVKCSCGWVHTVAIGVKDNAMPASGMDELV